MRPVGRDHHSLHTVEPGHAGGALAHDAAHGERARGGVAREDGDGIVALGRHVDVGAVGAHRHPRRTVEGIDAGDAVLLLLDERERAGGDVAPEDGDRVVARADDVHVGAVGAHGHGARGAEAEDATRAVLLALDEAESPATALRVKTTTELPSALAT